MSVSAWTDTVPIPRVSAKIAQDISTAVREIFKKSCSSVSIRHVEAAARLYMISPPKNGTPETLLITSSNIHQCSDKLDKSKEFLYSSSMFTEYKACKKKGIITVCLHNV